MEIHVDGVFDPAAARAVAGQISSVPASTAVIVNFTNVVQFHDSAVAPLAQALAEHSLVTLRGMGRHQLRLLRYLGARFLDGS
jgi:hypothetical protein